MALETILTRETIDEYTSYGYWVNRVITDYLDDVAERAPGKTALTGPRRQLTYAELKREVDHCAPGLPELGVGTGDVVSSIPNWIEWIVVRYAATRIGAISNLLIPIYREREAGFMAGLARSKVIVVPAGFRGFGYPAMISKARMKAPALEHVLVIDDKPGQARAPRPGRTSWPRPGRSAATRRPCRACGQIPAP